jgi:hypothetical protein
MGAIVRILREALPPRPLAEEPAGDDLRELLDTRVLFVALGVLLGCTALFSLIATRGATLAAAAPFGTFAGCMIAVGCWIPPDEEILPV